MNRLDFCGVIIFCMITVKLASQSLTPPDAELLPFYSGLASPVGIYHCGDTRLFIPEQSQGDIEIINTSGGYIGKFLDLTGLISTGGERGLLGMAFHPQYESNGFFYVNYTNTTGSTVIARYQVSSDINVANPASASILLNIAQPYANHNGGHIAFGPDGYLYIGMGDGGSSGDPQNRSQNPLELLGKMLRIDVDGGTPYAIPPSNPFFGQADTLPEIWALGLRNPWKFSFDALTGDMWIGDVGQNIWEEINMEPAGSTGGSNWGWKCYEGNASYSSFGCQSSSFYDFPVRTYNHSTDGFCSITGGAVYRGQNFPSLYGIYFFADYCDGSIIALSPNGLGGYNESSLYEAGAGIVMFGEDVNGELYVVKNTGSILKLQDTCPFYPNVSSNGNGGLTADQGNQYWWYRNDVLIEGATSQSFTPTQSGQYYARVSNGSCTRQTNSLDWLVVSGIGGCTYLNATNYNAIAVVDDGSCQFSVDCDCPADLDVDGQIGVGDLILFMGQFGSVCND